MPVASVIAFWLDVWGSEPISGSDALSIHEAASLSVSVLVDDQVAVSEVADLRAALSASDVVRIRDFSVPGLTDLIHIEDTAAVIAHIGVFDVITLTDILRHRTGDKPGIDLHGVYTATIPLRGSYVIIALKGTYDPQIPLRGRYEPELASRGHSDSELVLSGAL